jgi:putative tricarboxylic transport membrane protein
VSIINVDALEMAVTMVFQWKTFMWLGIGIFMGISGGALPGLTAATSMALFLPLGFKLPTPEMLGLLIGIYKGAVFGGSISAISFATPGTPEAAATVYDGHKLMLQGKGRKAILMALYASVTADILSDLVLIVVAPLLAIVALAFGPSEKVWLVVLAVSLLAALSGRHLMKGLLSAAIGFFCATIGSDPIGEVQRNTFGLWQLRDGVHLIPLVVGLFAMGRMLEEALHLMRLKKTTENLKERIGEIFSNRSEGLSFREYASCWREMTIGFCLGTFVGAMPGLGSTVGAFLSYSAAKQFQPHKKIGTGKLEGVAAAESGNNATVGPTLIPLLAFGIPGSSSAALLGGALTLHGFDPNPRMFELYPHAVYALFIILLIGNLFNLGIGRFFALLFAKLALLPRELLIPLVMLMAVLGCYAYQGDTTDVWVMLVFGFLGFFFRLWDIPEAPLIVTFLVAPMLEQELRRALIIQHGSWFDALFHSNLAIGLAVAAVILTAMCVRFNVMERIADASEREAKAAARDVSSE